MENSDLDFEIRFYEGVLARKGDFLQALVALGDLYTRKGFLEKGLAVDLKLVSLRPQDPTILYNLACSYSLLGNIEAAFTTMKSAIACGYNDFSYMEQDADLRNLICAPRFQHFLTRYKNQFQADRAKKAA